MTVETRFFDGAYHTINGLYARKLALAPTIYDSQGRIEFGNFSGSWGIRVWIRDQNGVETELTAGQPVAIVTRTENGAGIQFNTWTCPQHNLNLTDAIVVRVYDRVDTGSWTLRVEFITEQLGGIQINEGEWTIYYYTYRSYDAKNNQTLIAFQFGSATANSRIENFTWTPQLPPPAVGYSYSDGLACIQVG